jgi:cytoskeletal protein RodZ
VEGNNEESPILPPEPDSQPSLSKTIFSAIGGQLRRQREVLGFSFEEVERHTHVRRHYLEALEEGNLEHLPSSVQARGMLSNYARFLDMDADSILLDFADGLQARLREKQPIPEQETADKKDRKALPRGLRAILSFDVIFGGGLIILLVTFAIWGTSQVVSIQEAPSLESTLSISAALLETPLPGSGATPTASPVIEIAPTPTGNGTAIPLPTALQGRIQIAAIILERAWMRVTVDGKVEFEGRVLPGNTLSFGGEQSIEVLTSNGSAVQITYNQNNMGVMGNFGEIVGRIYTESGVYIPTPTITPSPTQTKPATPGPARTITPVELP